MSSLFTKRCQNGKFIRRSSLKCYENFRRLSNASLTFPFNLPIEGNQSNFVRTPQILLDDYLPQQMCQECVQHLKQAVAFKKQIESVDCIKIENAKFLYTSTTLCIVFIVRSEHTHVLNEDDSDIIVQKRDQINADFQGQNNIIGSVLKMIAQGIYRFIRP